VVFHLSAKHQTDLPSVPKVRIRRNRLSGIT